MEYLPLKTYDFTLRLLPIFTNLSWGCLFPTCPGLKLFIVSTKNNSHSLFTASRTKLLGCRRGKCWKVQNEIAYSWILHFLKRFYTILWNWTAMPLICYTSILQHCLVKNDSSKIKIGVGHGNFQKYPEWFLANLTLFFSS